MTFLRFFAPIRAVRDLRLYLAQRRPHELAFLALSVVITTLIIAGFVKDSHVEPVYKRNIVYVESWPANRSDEEIRARQQIDLVKEKQLAAERQKRLEERQAAFKRLDEKLESWGL